MRSIAVLVLITATAGAQAAPADDWRPALATRQRACLAPAAAVSTDPLRSVVRGLAHLTGNQRWEHVQPAWFLERAVEAQVRLSAERSAAAAAIRDRAATLARRYTDEAAEDRARAIALADILRALGHPEYARALPAVEPERVVLLPAADAPVRVLDARGEPYARFGGRVLTVVSLDDLARRPAPVLYLSRAEFVADLRNLGDRERDREFRRRSRDGATPAAYEAHLLSLDIDQAVLAAALVERVAAADPQHPAVAAFVNDQLARLRTRLAAGAAIKPADAARRLEICRRAVTDEAARRSTEARRRGDRSLADRIDAVARSLP